MGLIGGSLALAFRRSGLVGEILGVSSPATIARALELGVIDRGLPRGQEAEALAEAELVVLAGPVEVILRQLAELAPAFRPGATVTDVGSTKRAIVAAAAAHLPETVSFVGGHPMAGSEGRGVAEADQFLFENAVYVLCPARDRDRPAAERYGALAGALGARVIVMSPASHDRIAATISHLPQLVAVALMNLAADQHELDPNTLRLAAGGFRDLTRIASSPFEIWRDICATNRDEIQGLLELMIGRLLVLRELVGEEALGERFARAAASRALIQKNVKGFLHPVHQVVVTAPDEVGVILRLAAGLAGAEINIKDIEVLKVREGEGGTIMLGFDSTADRARALEVIRALGFTVRVRE